MSRPVRPDRSRSARRRTRGSLPIVAVVAAVVVLLVAAVAVRAATLTVPDVTMRVTHSATVRIPGAPPTPAWPSAGQAALAVPGLGSLGTSGGQTARPIASVTKVMTAYLILQHDPLRGGGDGFQLTVTRADARAEAADVGEDQSVVPVAAGERLSERQLLEALLIPSGDNIAQMLAARQAGSVAGFVAEMNREARALGMDHTTYTDPSGFDPTTVSTAGDQLRLFERAIRLPVFRQIVSMPSVTLPVAGTVTNFDPLISEGYEGKTGSDSAAEGCLAFFTHITAGGRRLTVVGVVLGQGDGSSTSVILDAAGDAAQRLVGSLAPAIRARTVLSAHSPVIVATSADGRRLVARTTTGLRVIGWGGLREHLVIRTHSRGASLRAGEQLGLVRLGGTLPAPAGAPTRTAARVSRRLSAPGLGWRLTHVF